MQCPNCGSSDLLVWTIGGGYKVLRCSNCRVGWRVDELDDRKNGWWRNHFEFRNNKQSWIKMADISKANIRELLQDAEFRNSVLDAMTSSVEIEDDLVKDIVDELSDAVEDDPGFRRELVSRVLMDGDSKQRILDTLVEELQ